MCVAVLARYVHVWSDAKRQPSASLVRKIGGVLRDDGYCGHYVERQILIALHVDGMRLLNVSLEIRNLLSPASPPVQPVWLDARLGSLLCGLDKQILLP